MAVSDFFFLRYCIVLYLISPLAISASAPVWGFPLDSCSIDSSSRVVTYAASESAGSAPLCTENLKSSYVLIHDIGQTDSGRALLSSSMGLCTPLQSSQDITSLLNYLQSPLFNLAEGSYPFPSSYITFALTGTHAPLPPWAMQVMCEPLGEDFGIKVTGNVEDVTFTVEVGDMQVYVDWDVTSNNGYVSVDQSALRLASVTAQAVQVWYNVTGTLPQCIDWEGGSAPNDVKSLGRVNPLSRSSSPPARKPLTDVPMTDESTTTCTLSPSDLDPGTAWNALVCNEGINLVNWWAQGTGGDLYWPPNQERGATLESLVPGSLLYCPYLKALGLEGVPDKPDVWARWMDTGRVR